MTWSEQKCSSRACGPLLSKVRPDGLADKLM